MGSLLRCIARDGSVICTVLDSTDIVARAEQIHKTSAVVTAALGRLLTASSIMGSLLKNDEDSVTVRFAGDGASGTMITVADGRGNTRGYVTNPIVEIPLNKYGKLDVAGAVGSSGTLTVIKDVGLPEPSTGSVPIVSGEIAQDITSYYAVSEQIPTVCALGVLVNPKLDVKASGGYLIQLLPGAGNDVIDMIEQRIKEVRPVTEMLENGMTTSEIMSLLMDGLEPEILYECSPVYRCDCSRARVERALVSLGRAELQKLCNEQQFTEVCCHFCDEKYRFDNSAMRSLLSRAK